ncbi:unnamed protein product [Sphagnum balticum]
MLLLPLGRKADCGNLLLQFDASEVTFVHDCCLIVLFLNVVAVATDLSLQSRTRRSLHSSLALHQEKKISSSSSNSGFL